MPTFIKRSAKVEAEQLRAGDVGQHARLGIALYGRLPEAGFGDSSYSIQASGGTIWLSAGDWIVTREDGGREVYKPEAFAAEFQRVG